MTVNFEMLGGRITPATSERKKCIELGEVVAYRASFLGAAVDHPPGAMSGQHRISWPGSPISERRHDTESDLE